MVRRLGTAVILALVASMLVPGRAESVPAFSYITRSAKVGPGISRAALKAPCPRRTRVISGGVVLDGAKGAGSLVSSYPYDNRDRGRTPDDGWVGIVNNESSLTTRMYTHAVCVRGGTTYRYESA